MLSLLIFAACSVSCFADSSAAEGSYAGNDIKEISTAEELFAITEEPEGSYALAKDIDLAGYEWLPAEFRGCFDGRGHNILNVHISSLSEFTKTVYDCNHKPYEAYFGGFFSSLEGARLCDLSLLNADYSFDCGDECVFTGGIAGYISDSSISNVSVLGRSYLATAGKCWGSGGIAGYGGSSMISGCRSDMEMTDIDKGSAYKDEQFMGGAYALGYIDLLSNDIKIRGYAADHGYVHSGGLAGAYYKYDGASKRGNISGNSISGKITFFEDNVNRRAYCSALIGEVMDWSLDMNGNNESFVRDEIYDYGAKLGPHWDCAAPAFTEDLIESSYENCGFTQHKCENCGYSYRDAYKARRIRAESCSMEIEDSDSGLFAGDSYDIKLAFEPADAAPMDIEIISDNDEVAFVEDGKLLHINKKGSARISAEIDGKTMDELEINAGSHSDKMLKKYGIYIAAAALITAAVCIVLLRRNNTTAK